MRYAPISHSTASAAVTSLTPWPLSSNRRTVVQASRASAIASQPITSQRPGPGVYGRSHVSPTRE